MNIIPQQNEIKSYERVVENSYANNSKLYVYLEKKATLAEIIEFLIIDSFQPNFYNYISYSLEIAPRQYHEIIKHHMDEEADHGQLYQSMLLYLKSICPVEIDMFQLENLAQVHQTFKKKYILKNPFEHFVGGFYATEMMSCKRYQQIERGFNRLNLNRNLEFINIHATLDSVHTNLVRKQLIRPLLANSCTNRNSILEGIQDRVKRSELFIRWYERQRIVIEN